MTIDGTLADWQAISADHEWAALLLGNGLSINVWPKFAYGSLFEHVSASGLTTEDVELFDGTPNFERVLGDLSTAIRIAKVVGVDPDPFYDRYRRIQQALGHAVREVHLHRTDVPDRTLESIRAALLNFEWIFTASYDLITYWAMGAHPTFKPFKDHFRGSSLEFDPLRSTVNADDVPVYFLHGALHLIVQGSGRVRKLRRTAIHNILDQFGEPIERDPQARPLLVTEGSARDKLRAIEANDYLSHSLELLRAVDLPLVIFGSSLGPEDQHLIDAINEHPSRPVAVSMRPGSKRQLAAKQADIFGRLEAETLLFYEASSHPLGNSTHCCEVP